MKKAFFPTLVALGLRIVSPAWADAPLLLNYQGHLSAPDGTAKDGTFSMQFAVYDAAVGGNQLPTGTPWSEAQSVTVTDGVFNVLLGSVTALPTTLFDGGPTDAAGPLRFLQVTVDGEALAPRKRIASSAYALQARLDTSLLSTLVPIVRKYTSSSNWSKPAGLLYVTVEVQGGGGYGGGGGAVDWQSGAGGGAGGYAKKLIAAADLNATEVVTVGGVAGSSSFGSHCSATGGASGATSSSDASGGSGGTATGGDVNIAGAVGFPNIFRSTTPTRYGGPGAASPLGTPGGPRFSIGPGASASGFGAGGGGGVGQNSNPQNAPGGAGAPGVVIVTEHYL